MTPEEVKKLAEETYGRVPRVAEVKPRMRPQEPQQEAPRTVTLSDPRVTQPSLSRYYLVPSYTSGRPGEAEAIDVLTHILGRGANSRLYQKLVVDSGSPSAPAPATTAPRSTRPASASTRRRSRAPA